MDDDTNNVDTDSIVPVVNTTDNGGMSIDAALDTIADSGDKKHDYFSTDLDDD
jgi:hypothetical protein